MLENLKTALADDPIVDIGSWGNHHLHAQSPLPILQSATGDELCSFRPPWTRADCKNAVSTTGRYEASANVLWCSLDLLHQEDIPREDGSFAQVVRCARVHFPNGKGTGDTQKVDRLFFPLPLEAFVLDVKSLDSDAFEQSMPLSSGHTFVYAWYLSMFKAITTNDSGYLRALWQAGLTCCVRVRVAECSRDVLADTLAFSETARTLEGMADSFWLLSKKVARITSGMKYDDAVKELNRANILFQGAKFNRSLFGSTQLVHSTILPETVEFLHVLMHSYGRELFADTSTKLPTLIRAVQKANAQSGWSLPETVHDLIVGVWVALERDLVPGVKFFSDSVLGKGKDGSPGWAMVHFTKLTIARAIEKVVQEAQDAKKPFATELQEKVLPKCARLEAFHLAFPLRTAPPVATADGSDQEAVKDHAQQNDDEPDPFDDFLSELSPAASALATFFLNLHEGALDKDVRALTNVTCPMLLLTSVDPGDQKTTGEAGKLIRAFMRHTATNEAIGSTRNDSMPMVTVRSLVRGTSDPEKSRDDMEKERRAVWEQSVANRKRVAHVVGLPPKATSADYGAACEKTPAKQFKGKPGESHRLFVFQAELWDEHPAEPWAKTADLHWTNGQRPCNGVIEYMLAQSRPYDICVLLDGRSRANRRLLDEKLDARNPTEVLITYQGKVTRVKQRSTFLSRSNHEHMFVLMGPSLRTNFACRERKKYQGGDTRTTASTMYTDVPPVPLAILPKIATEEKSKIYTKPASAPPNPEHLVSQPLHFQEYLPREFWKTVCADFGAGLVVDLTPSAELAAACLDSGTQYVALCNTKPELTWFQNVLDRISVSIATREGSGLYAQGLKPLLEACVVYTHHPFCPLSRTTTPQIPCPRAHPPTMDCTR